MRDRRPIRCIIPPYIMDRLAASRDPAVRARAVAALASAAAFRAHRGLAHRAPEILARRAPEGGKRRMVYDARNARTLPGRLVLSEGGKRPRDPAVREAYEHSGATYDFYQMLFRRDSLDDHGMPLVSSVHVADTDGQPLDNAFWNGEQMAYGDGDAVLFTRFTKALDVVAHELTHGVQAFTSNLEYRDQPGALNEHFSDVFGILVRQWKQGETADAAGWLIGADILVPAKTRRAIRDMLHPGTAYVDDPDLGTDPQPGHMRGLYRGPKDNGGVHLNSGIPSRAFALAATKIGGKAWEVTGRIWYETLLRLPPKAQFADCARMSIAAAAGHGAAARKAVADAWRTVGVRPRRAPTLEPPPRAP